MQPTNLLLLTLSALPSTLSAPTIPHQSNHTLPILPRGSDKWSYGDPKIGCFTDTTCTIQNLIPPPPKMHFAAGWDCIKFTPQNDNVGINWGNGPRADGVTFFTDDKCEKYAAKRVVSPEQSSDNGKGKSDKCISYLANGGNWRSVRFAYPEYQGGTTGMRL